MVSPASNPSESPSHLTSGPTTPDLNISAKYCDANGRRNVIQTGGVYATFCQEEWAYFCKSIAIEMGGVSRYFSKVSGSGVGVHLMINSQSLNSPTPQRNPILWGTSIHCKIGGGGYRVPSGGGGGSKLTHANTPISPMNMPWQVVARNGARGWKWFYPGNYSTHWVFAISMTLNEIKCRVCT